MSNERAGIEEQHSQACNSSNLRVESHRRSAGDVLIASGMSRSEIGANLSRLRAEYGSDSVPRRNATATDHRLMMGRLKSLPGVLKAVAHQAHRWHIDRPEAVALAVVSHWLDNVCRHCEGRGKESIKDTPSLSTCKCKHCQGSGKTDLTHGSAGRQIDSFLLDCISRWAQDTKGRLYWKQ